MIKKLQKWLFGQTESAYNKHLDTQRNKTEALLSLMQMLRSFNIPTGSITHSLFLGYVRGVKYITNRRKHDAR